VFRVRPYRTGDLKRLDLRDYERKWIDFFTYEGIEARLQLDKSFTLFKDETPIAAWGIYVYWPGVAEIWLSLSKGFYQSKLSCLRIFKRCLEDLMMVHGLHRIHTLISEELPVNQRFCEFFGFMPEGVQRKYGPWADNYIMYARVI